MMKHSRILVVDDESTARMLISDILSDEGYTAITAENGREALKKIKQDDPDLVILDLKLPDISGLDVLAGMRKSHSNLPVILVSAHGDIGSAVSAVKLGAYDFMEKPLDANRLVVAVRNALWNVELRDEIVRLKEEVEGRYYMVGTSQVLKTLRERISQAAFTNAHVLIMGETGSGKDLVARAIHNQSQRADEPFVKLNCAAIPHELVESELFGYKKGAFTGAHSDKLGRIESAHKGAILFDEIGDMNLSAQAKLLHFLDTSTIQRLGETKIRHIDVRVIAATNKDLSEEVKANRFREDLYYRLNVIDVRVPPLRSHAEDIPEMVEYFLERCCKELGIPVKELEEPALNKLMSLPWPGNVRQLRNTIEKAVSLTPELILKVEDLPESAGDEEEIIKPQESKNLQDVRKEFERRFILRILKEEDWNVAEAARLMGLDRTNLYRKMKVLKIDRNS